ncbi:metallophosphoesterase [Pricia sp.]|uniref:metallophosphoesterase n=1 Tax=Pricia sp. TaxID=2268138 RepID=UPI0035932E7E
MDIPTIKKSKISRRNFLTTLFLGSMGLVFLDSFWFERYLIDWKEFDISDGSENKIKMIQLSDLHINSIKSFHKTMAERINKERPDALFVTGDSVNSMRGVPILDAFLAMIDHDIPKFAIMGNVDYTGQVDSATLRKTYEKHNGKFLINQNHTLRVKDRTVNIVGVDDYICGYPDFSKASRNLDLSLDTIVLNHCPAYRDEIDTMNAKIGQKIKLILSGHTHGGQITFFGKAIFTPYGSGNYVKGWYKNALSRLYVSKGVGTRGLPLRFGARAEAIIFHV